MLNIARIGPGGEDYYLAQVVSAEDYYVERGEAPGVWDGALARELQLDGRVEAVDLRAVLAGRDPRSGEVLAGHPARKVTGFDLAFRAPKSVSLAWGLADDPDVADHVRDAHREAVRSAIGYLEREAGWTRRGAGGAERLPGDGLVAAAFEHRTSREGDPLLHTHVVVANLTRTTDDGVWRTLDSRRLYKHAKTAGFLYQSTLRHELTTRLGVEWQPVVNGHADLEGFDRPLIEAFSQRRAQILARLDALGFDSPQAAQIATYQTRKAKQLTAPETELRVEWAQRAAELGFDPQRLRELLHEVDHDREQLPVDLEALAGLLADDNGLTEHAATFARRDAVQAIAAALPAGGTVAEVEALTDRLLTDGRLVAVGPGPQQLSLLSRTATDVDDPVRYTTVSLLATEARAIDNAVARRDDAVATVDPDTLAWVLRQHQELGDDQAAMVDTLCTSGEGLAVVVGKAGSGKTHALKVAHEAWQGAGIQVIGCSLAARAARNLEEASGIPSTTVHRLLGACDDPSPGSPLPPGGVVVVDEAGMVGTRQLARLLDHAQAQGTKVVLVGDPAQLPEIDAGGLFRGLVARLDTLELTDNRRQQTPWERATVDRLRQGDTRQALAGYAEHGRLTIAAPDELTDKVLDHWQQLVEEHGPASTVLIARTRAQAGQLNAAARQRLVDTGRLAGMAVHAPGSDIQFAVGDRVVCLRNHRRLDVDNGTRATVTEVDPHQGVTIRPDGRHTTVTLPGDYIAEGHLEHGYAITGHKSQGLTVDHALVVADDTIDAEWGYVAMSRGRHTNHLYLADPNAVDPRRHAPQPADDPTGRLARRLTVSRADTPLVDRDIYDPIETACRWQRLATDIDEARKTDHQRRTLTHELDKLTEQREFLATYYNRDRARLDEVTTGLSRLTRSSRAERDRLHGALQGYLERTERIDQRTVELHDQLRQLGPRPNIDAWQAEADRLRDVLDAAAAQTARRHEHHPPDWLTYTLGHPPEQPEARALWRDAGTRIQAFRTRWQIDDPQRPYGDVLAASQVQRRDRQNLDRDLRETVREIHQIEHPERRRGMARKRSIGRGLSL